MRPGYEAAGILTGMRIVQPKARRLVLEVTRLSPAARRQRREFQRALKAVPRPVPWDWAAPRLMPLLAGPRFDQPGEALVRTTSSLGPAIEFGLPVGDWFARVDRPVAERWETTADQLVERAMANLREAAAALDAGAVTTGVMSGRELRLLDGRPPWASSLVLDSESLVRLFGAHDQLFAAARTDCLLSMPPDTPVRAFSEIVVDLEQEDLALWLDPFILEAGKLTWGGTLDPALDGLDDID